MNEHERPEVDSELPTVPRPADATGPTTLPSGRMIAGYRVLQKVGEGGMGVVYEAEQEKPVRRRIALKLIKPGMDTAQVVARFESERQALALMSHPSIASIFDGGATDDGRPYFAMELVHGEPLTQYCDKNRLTLKERLELLIQVCEGVQHAHQKGIIHRDLKPSNILITIQDEKPVPKIIDFGVAKATSQRLTDKTLYTQLGQWMGTPAYMSPEQAEMTGIDVDTRSDVYSLGVVLYELLAGALPIDPRELKKAGFEGFARVLRETEPNKPSTRVHTLSKTPTDPARTRRLAMPALEKELRGDLDWITMKALEKDRTRRYGSVSELAADIQRHLRHEPVLASPPSVIYRAGKFVRRHRVGVTVGALALGLLVAFAAAMTVQSVRIANERDRADREAEVANQVSRFMIELFEVSDPDESKGEDLTAREILDRGAERIEEELTDQPEVQARLMASIGTVYQTLGLYAEAERLLRRALSLQRELLGPGDEETLTTLSSLSVTLSDLGRNSEYEALELELLAVRRRVCGEDHPDTLNSYDTLGGLRVTQGRYEEAEELLERALAGYRRLGDTDELVSPLTNMAYLRFFQGQLQDAADLYREALAIALRFRGETSRTTLIMKFNLAAALGNLMQLEEAERLTREVLEGRTEMLGPEHDSTLQVIGNLASILGLQGKHDEAERLYHDIVEKRHAISGLNHPWTRAALHGHGDELLALGRYAEAEERLTDALTKEIRIEGPEHPNTLEVELSVARLRLVEGRAEEALEMLESNIRATRNAEGNNLALGDALALLGETLNALERYAEAEEALAEAISLLASELPERHPDLAEARSHRGTALAGLGRFDEAEPLLLEAHRALAAVERLDPERVSRAAERLADFYRSRGNDGEASPRQKRALLPDEEEGEGWLPGRWGPHASTRDSRGRLDPPEHAAFLGRFRVFRKGMKKV